MSSSAGTVTFFLVEIIQQTPPGQTITSLRPTASTHPLPNIHKHTYITVPPPLLPAPEWLPF
jgi:hypothetical protein